jgi:hypothetical protein
MNGLSLTVGITATMECKSAGLANSDASSGLLISLVSKVKVHTHGLVISLVKFGLVSSTRSNRLGAGKTEDAQAFEVGVSTSIYNINLVAYGYSGEGVGTTCTIT